MVDFVRLSTAEKTHDMRVDTMRREDAAQPDVTVNNVMSGLEAMNVAVNELRAQLQQLQVLQNITPVAHYEKEQILEKANELERSAHEVTETQAHGKGFVIAENMHHLADQTMRVIAQAA
ncbi:MAG: hypothetical protein PHE68_04710 [Candidatus Peribacteraceae bacterium]|nr:hypothetical protein [Candidatus Peribacteraceae bacterium]MDD5075097.1 hypothetical protein [Candidatus Peribacteraceae bacterium]